MGSSRQRGFSVTSERLAFIEQKMREMGIESREALAKAANLSSDVIHKKLFSGRNVDRSTVEAIAKTLKIQHTEIIEPERWHRPSKTAKSQASTNIDWHYVCRTMLDRQKKLSTNEVIASEAMQFDLLDDEIFISVALVERKEPERLSQNVHPARPLEQYEEKPPIEYEKFREQILRQGKSDRIAIIGEPGAGKTTLLQHIAFWILDKELGLPIWISLGDLIKNGDLQRLKDYLTQVWLDDAVLNVTQDVKSDFLKQLNEQRVWLLLDGADEIVASSGIALREINNQLRGWLSQSCIILTCRINVWEVDINALRDFPTYRTKEFHYPTQVEQFIESGFRKSNQQSGERLKNELANTERTRLQQLVRNPLRLMMLCTTWHEQESLPATKAELYKRFVSVFYKWNRSKWKKKDLNYAFFPNTVAKQEKLNKALGRLACRALDEESSPFRLPHNLVCDELGYPDEDGSDFWLALNLGWLQVARDSDKPSDKVYTFFHPTFQEYFAALAIDNWHIFLNHVPENPNHSDAKYRIFEPRWQEVITLWFGRKDKRTSQQQKEQFITELTEFEDISGKYGFYSKQAYLVAARGIGQYESSKVYKIANQTVKWSFGYFDSAQKQWMKFAYYLQQEAKSALLETHRQAAVEALVSLVPTIHHGFTIIDVLEYLWKISPGNPIVFNTLKKLTNPDQDKFVFKYATELWWDIDPGNEGLLKRVINLDAQDELGYRGFHIKLEEFNKDTAIKFLTELTKSARTQENRFHAAARLLKIDGNNPIAVSALIEIIQAANIDNPGSIWVAEAAAWHLEKFGGADSSLVLTLEKLIKNSKEELLRGQAAITLARINPDNEIALKTLDSLIQKSQNAWIRWHVAKCLGELFPYHKLAIETLKNLAQTIRVDSVRLSMAQDLWKIDPSNSITASVLVELIRSTQDDFTRSIAISYLAKIDCSKTTALLEELAQSVQYEFIRWRVTHELSILAPENDLVQPILEELAQSAKTSRTRYYAADSLLDLSPGNKPAIKTLIELVKSSKRANDDIDTQTTDYFLADASDNAADRLIKSLKTINISDVVTSLRSCLTDEILENNSEKFIRCHSIIGRCAQNMSYPKFYQAWRSSSSTVDATK